MGRIGKVVLSVVVIAVVFGLINLVLVGAQTWMHQDENARLEELEDQIKEVEQENKATEDWLMERQERLEVLYAEGEDRALYLDELVNTYPDGFPEDVYEEFQALEEEYEAMTDEYEELYAEFEEEQAGFEEGIDTYNTLFDEYEELAEEAGSMWVLIPGYKKGH